MENRAVGVVMGSGGARGLAHIGVLKALEEHNIPISMLVGTSIGALVGGLYASGLSVAELEALAGRTDRITVAKIMSPKLFSAGLIDNKRVLDFIRGFVGSRRIEQLEIPFAAVATEFVSGKEIILRKGPLVDAIMASIAIPTIFQPVSLNGQYLLDGGLSNPLPVSVARDMGATKVIAVNVSPSPEKITKTLRSRRMEELRTLMTNMPFLVTESLGLRKRSSANRHSKSQPTLVDDSPKKTPTLANVFVQSITIATNNLVAQQLRVFQPDVLVSPNIGDYDTLEFFRGREIMRRGYDAANKEMSLDDSRLSQRHS